MRARYFVFYFLFSVFCFLADSQSWTTKTDIPGFEPDTTSVALAGLAIFVHSSNAVQYNFHADQWTTINSRPVDKVAAGAVAVSETSAVFLGGGSPTLTDVVTTAHEVTSTGSWKTIRDHPYARHLLSLCLGSGYRMWTTGGHFHSETQDSTYYYDTVADVWSSASDMPVARYQHGSTYYDGFVRVIGGYPLGLSDAVYTVATDQWTTATSSIPTTRPLNGVAHNFGCDVFCFGGVTGVDGLLEVYSIPLDTWTTLVSSPLPNYDVATVAFNFRTTTLFQVMLVAGHGSGVTRTHAFTLNTPSVIGDPLITSLSGDLHHLSLFPGVFTLLSSPSIVVNIAVDSLATLPPDENTVVTMVGVVAVLPDDSVALIECSVNFEMNDVVCRSQQVLHPGSVAFPIHSVAAISSNGRGLDLTLPLWNIHLAFNRVAVSSVSNTHGVFVGGPSCWMDVFIRSPLAAVKETVLAGLLLDPSRPPSHYEVESGCLFELPPTTSGGGGGSAARHAVLLMGMC